MRKTFIVLSVCVVAGLIFASTAVAAGGPAIVIKNDGGCGMPGADANGNITFGGVGLVTTIVENGNKVTLKCKGDDIANASGSGQSFKAFDCGIGAPSGGFFFTNDSHATVSASGVGTLTCTYRK